MVHLFKFILIFNRRIFIGFNLVLYTLLLFFFNLVNASNVITYTLYLAFIFLILLMKAVYEVTIYKKEIGVLKTLGGGTLQLLLLRVFEKAIYICSAWSLLIVVKLSLQYDSLKMVMLNEVLTVFIVECIITVAYYSFAIMQDITTLLKED